MPNKQWNDVHAGDTQKESDGSRKAKITGDTGGRLAPLNPSFSNTYTSQGSQDMKSGQTPPRKK